MTTISEHVRLIRADVFEGIQRAYHEAGSDVTTAQYYEAKWALDCWHGRCLNILDYPYQVAERKRWGAPLPRVEPSAQLPLPLAA